jgi:hypothetical protein
VKWRRRCALGLQGCGVLALAVGCGLLSVPAGVIAGGVGLVAFGIATELG